MAHKMTVQDLTLNLKAAGFDKKMIQQYLSCWNEGKKKEQLLSAKRAMLLERIHREEKQIDCLDYLVYQIEERTPPYHMGHIK